MVELHAPISERIGRTLRESREAQGLTRQQLSEKSTVSDRQISAIELGEKGPSMNSLELLLRSLGLSADRIFYRRVLRHLHENTLSASDLSRIQNALTFLSPLCRDTREAHKDMMSVTLKTDALIRASR